ncbi:2 4-dihydroxyhept-2-ene-1 7-dioic acid aldolase [Fusarium sp. NRRL 52700]|nr:2 4-dihydroxyhept-2-ene-1 7-dioic acid aldolase [Fusarium sp. NRRL 52700]
MLACRNSLNTKITNWQLCKALGIRLVTNPQVVQLAKNAKFDSVFIDLEHSTLFLDDAGRLYGAGLALGIMPFVRVSHQCGNGFVQKILDGCRSTTGQLVMSLRPYPQAEVICETNEHASTVFVMIENKKAVENVEEIAAVEGVDVVIVGSNDFSDFRSDTFREALASVSRTCRKY